MHYLDLEYLQDALVQTNIVSFLRVLRLYFTTDRIYQLHLGHDVPLCAVLNVPFLLHPHPIILAFCAITQFDV